MADWAYNPAHGWSQGPYDGVFGGCGFEFQDPYGWTPSSHGFFPAPPGLGWYEIPAAMNGADYSGMGGPMMMDPSMGGICGMGGIYGMSGMGGMSLGGPLPFGQTWQQIGIPVHDNGTPGINIKNATGGIGLEPGYNYIFPDEHCKVHVLKCATPPWQLEGTEQVQFNPHVVPTCVTIKTLMQQFGCDNAEPAKNVMYEVVQGGNGKWYRGVTVTGDEDDKCGKRVGEMGWGVQSGGKDAEIVWLYFTKDRAWIHEDGTHWPLITH